MEAINRLDIPRESRRKTNVNDFPRFLTLAHYASEGKRRNENNKTGFWCLRSLLTSKIIPLYRFNGCIYIYTCAAARRCWKQSNISAKGVQHIADWHSPSCITTQTPCWAQQPSSSFTLKPPSFSLCVLGGFFLAIIPDGDLITDQLNAGTLQRASAFLEARRGKHETNHRRRGREKFKHLHAVYSRLFHAIALAGRIASFFSSSSSYRLARFPLVFQVYFYFGTDRRAPSWETERQAAGTPLSLKTDYFLRRPLDEENNFFFIFSIFIFFG